MQPISEAVGYQGVEHMNRAISKLFSQSYLTNLFFTHCQSFVIECDRRLWEKTRFNMWCMVHAQKFQLQLLKNIQFLSCSNPLFSLEPLDLCNPGGSIWFRTLLSNAYLWGCQIRNALIHTPPNKFLKVNIAKQQTQIATTNVKGLGLRVQVSCQDMQHIHT